MGPGNFHCRVLEFGAQIWGVHNACSSTRIRSSRRLRRHAGRNASSMIPARIWRRQRRYEDKPSTKTLLPTKEATAIPIPLESFYYWSSVPSKPNQLPALSAWAF